jgi:hypothetical protein
VNLLDRVDNLDVFVPAGAARRHDAACTAPRRDLVVLHAVNTRPISLSRTGAPLR